MSPESKQVQLPDQYLMDKIDELGRGLESKMDRGFEAVERKFESVVTKGEYSSTVARLETEISHVKETMNSNLDSVRKDVTHVEEKVTTGFEDLEGREKARDTASARRVNWSITIAVALTGTITTIISMFL